MWFTLYSFSVHLIFLLATPWLAWNAWKTGKTREGLADRFGRLNRPWLNQAASANPIWIHAVSVGEAQMLPPLLERLNRRHPGVPVVVSTNTVTGQEVAKAQPLVAGTFFVPLDFGWAVRGILRRLRPRVLIILETEIWPNLIHETSQQGIPVVYLNGRISDRSFGRYLKIKPLLSQVLRLPAAFGMRSALDSERITRMGADPRSVHVLGNLKFESAYQLVESGNPLTRDDYGLSSEDFLIVGGSTFPGEEEMLIRLYDHLRVTHPKVRLLLAPRHPRRFEEAAQAILSNGHPLWRRSSGSRQGGPEDQPAILLLDVMGELKHAYGLSDLVFIGKSMGLTPVGVGGQNPLEPAAWSKPILFGPRMENFEEVARDLLGVGGAIKVESEEDLIHEASELLEDREVARQMGTAAFSLIEQSLGAAGRCIELVDEVLSQSPKG
jgi:3-deoxy-D-manno-octulosonic-acid transferase